MNRVAVLGNSVSIAPREDPRIKPYPALLQQHLGPGWTVLQRSVGGGTIADVEPAALAALEAEDPHAAIVQVGIVDCAPRPLKPWEREWLARVHPIWLQRRIVQFIHDHRAEILQRRRLIQLTPLATFRQSYRRILDACYRRGCVVAVLPIFDGTTEVVRRNPLLPGEIRRYNEAMDDPRPRFFRASELFGAHGPDELAVGPDSVHLNQRGHDLIAQSLASWLVSAIRPETVASDAPA